VGEKILPVLLTKWKVLDEKKEKRKRERERERERKRISRFHFSLNALLNRVAIRGRN